ncbi:CDP-archaeol synthase [Marinilabiliaceae bacterium ANBcel2]|nr:CDP-archaeol synthase [Marinilabiliaceae bacterium ANBcel2]
MSNFWQRSLTGIVIIIAIIGGMWWHSYSYLLIFYTVVLLGMLEFSELIKARHVKVQTAWSLIIGSFWYITLFLALSGAVSELWLIFVVPLIIGVFVSELFRDSSTPLINIACTLIIPFYVALPFSFLHMIVFSDGAYSYNFLLGFFLLIWANDSGAYLIGSSFGKHKLFKRISPKKTWEGAVGGFIFTIITALIIANFISNLHLLHWMVVGLLISVMGTLGDLVESMLKRSANIKDSGKLLPGHGGVLDRFDAVIFAAPLICAYLFIVHFLN